MSFTYNYSITTDFGGSVNTHQLHTSIVDDITITTVLIGIHTHGDDLVIEFVAELSGSELDQLDTFTASHTPEPEPVFLGPQGPQGPAGSLDSYDRVSVTGASYTIQTGDEIIGVLSSANSIACNLTLPEISTLGDPFKKRYTIVDEGGNASSYNITVSPTGGDLILGATGLVINGNYDSISIYSNISDNWFLI